MIKGNRHQYYYNGGIAPSTTTVSMAINATGPLRSHSRENFKLLSISHAPHQAGLNRRPLMEVTQLQGPDKNNGF